MPSSVGLAGTSGAVRKSAFMPLMIVRLSIRRERLENGGGSVSGSRRIGVRSTHQRIPVQVAENLCHTLAVEPGEIFPDLVGVAREKPSPSGVIADRLTPADDAPAAESQRRPVPT